MEVGAVIGSAPELTTSEGDASMTSTREERPRRPPLVIAFVIVGLGILFLATGLNRPSIANMRTVDLVHLLGTGVCLGGGLVVLVLNLVGRRTG